MQLSNYGMILVYGLPMLLIWIGYATMRRKRTQHNLAIRKAAQDAGLGEPTSLHPVIDPALCIGCASCVDACPEKKVLGIIHGKAALVNPASCIGHGACRTACPTQGITLVFGTEKRGVDIPLLKPNFETNVPGIFIAGELGGMGLIRNAIEQGRQAMEGIRQLDGIGKGDRLDVVIVGAGPTGISASLASVQHNLRYLTIEQDSLGGTVSHYPRGKLVMTAPVQLPVVGKVNFRETSKEKLLAFWEKITSEHQLHIQFNERLEGLTKEGDDFVVRTTRGSYRTRSILLAIGRRGTPRKLEVPGEDLSKVVYRLIDPEQYRNCHVLVVGGGDSALEAAWSIAEQPGTQVVLSYRSEAFARAKQKNRDKVQQAEAAGNLRVMLKSKVVRLTEDSVELEHEGKSLELPNNAVIVCAGGVLPTPFLKSIGIEVETKYGTA